ncbi:MAG: DmsC/YnfH family molybdoenzyme membrane anchor subunit [Bacillota bacterium]
MEWTSLSLFTVLSEAAVGLVLLYGLLGLTQAARSQPEEFRRLGQTALLTASVTTLFSMVISLEHLGWPLFAFRAIGALGSSWLSWEVLLTGLFALGAALLWWGGRQSPLPLWGFGSLSLVGLSAVYSSGMIYTLPSVPANAGGFPVLLFLAATLLTGGAALLLLLALTPAGRRLAPSWLIPLALLTVGAILLTALLTFAFAGAAASGLPEARAQAALFQGSSWYLVRMLLGLLLPALLLLWVAWRPKVDRVMLALPVVLVLAGELAGRILFFASTVFMGVNTGL